MKQEELSLETCQEIGHLFRNSRYGWIVYEEPKDPTFPEQEPELYDYWEPRKPWCEFYTRLASHPSITDMMNWLWFRGIEINRRSIGFVMDTASKRGIVLKSTRYVDACAEAVKIVLKEKER